MSWRVECGGTTKVLRRGIPPRGWELHPYLFTHRWAADRLIVRRATARPYRRAS
jgi:hypothetical protein